MIDSEAEIAVVVLADVELKDLIDHRHHVIERAYGLKRRSIGRPEDASRSGQDEGIFDDEQWDAAIVKSGGQVPVVGTDGAGGSGCAAIRIEELADVFVLRFHDGLRLGSALRIAQRWSVDAHGVAVVAETAEKGFDHGPIAKKVVPLVVLKVAGDDRRVAVITLFHQFEKDVRLLGLEIEIAELVDLKHVQAGETFEKLASRAVRQ